MRPNVRVTASSRRCGSWIRTAQLAKGLANEIARRAAEFDLIVLGSHGKGILKEIFVGSVTASVLRRVTCPVLVVR